VDIHGNVGRYHHKVLAPSTFCDALVEPSQSQIVGTHSRRPNGGSPLPSRVGFSRSRSSDQFLLPCTPGSPRLPQAKEMQRDELRLLQKVTYPTSACYERPCPP
jgi:hypothetical protein